MTSRTDDQQLGLDPCVPESAGINIGLAMTAGREIAGERGKWTPGETHSTFVNYWVSHPEFYVDYHS